MDDDGSAHSSLFGDLSTEEVTSKIILTAVIVLFMAVLFVLILHLYAKLAQGHFGVIPRARRLMDHRLAVRHVGGHAQDVHGARAGLPRDRRGVQAGRQEAGVDALALDGLELIVPARAVRRYS